eukprot:3466339-Amphidinium_carterae.1
MLLFSVTCAWLCDGFSIFQKKTHQLSTLPKRVLCACNRPLKWSVCPTYIVPLRSNSTYRTAILEQTRAGGE